MKHDQWRNSKLAKQERMLVEHWADKGYDVWLQHADHVLYQIRGGTSALCLQCAVLVARMKEE